MKRRIAVMLGLIMFVAVLPALAENGDWQFTMTPYAWGMGIKGDVGVGRITAPMDVKFSDAVKDLDLAGMLAAEINNGTWGVLCDMAYIKLSDDTDTLAGNFSSEVKEWIVQGAAVYRVAGNKTALVDIGVGGRYMGLDVEVGTPNDTDSKNSSLVDPLLVMRVRQQFSEKSFGVLAGDIGGFGASSDLTWQLTAAAGYSLTEDVSMLLGYRYLHYDYDKDRVVYDVAMQGLAVGVQIGF